MDLLKLIRTAILYSGISIIMASVIYMIINVSSADSFVTTWITFMAIGVAFTFIGAFASILKIKQ